MWGCDLNPEVIQWRPTSDEFAAIYPRFLSSSTTKNIRFTKYKKPV